MKRFLLLVMLSAVINPIIAQSRAIDTIRFSVSEVKISDENILHLLDSVFSSSPHEDTLIWNVFIGEGLGCWSSDTSYCLLVHRFDHIMAIMKSSIGFFVHKSNIVFITQNTEEEREHHDTLLTYTNVQRNFYCVSIDWDALWQSNLDDALKRSLVVEFASITDYHSDIICQKENGIWYWACQAIH